jgi:methylphosphotriester-DNA--protein-cysteine methyltransferase
VTVLNVEPREPLNGFVRRFTLIRGTAIAGPARLPAVARTRQALVFNLQEGDYRVFEHHTGRQRVMPPVQLVGAQTTRRADLLVTDAFSTFSIQFQHSGVYRLFHLPVDTLTNGAVDAVDVLGSVVSDVRDQLRRATTASAMARIAERFLSRYTAQATAIHPVALAADALARTGGRTRIVDLIRASGLSDRQFERRFIEQIGVSPKLCARVARVGSVLHAKALRPEQSWLEIGLEAGYFDQNHLIKDFKAIVGATPTGYLESVGRIDDGFLLSFRASSR